MYKSNPLEALKRVDHCFSQLGIQYWLHGGVLLGIARENDFLSHDTDIDVGIMAQDSSNAIKSMFLSNGFLHKQTLICNSLNIKEETFVYNGVGVDILEYHSTDDNMYTYAFDCVEKGTTWLGNINVIKYTWEKFEVEYCDFKGIKVPVPTNKEYWLSQAYGDWKIPREEWHYSYHTLNKVLIPNVYAKLNFGGHYGKC